MTAPNHALTGALVGLTVDEPALALPLAFLSHFALDTLPQYDPPGTEVQRIGSRRLIVEHVLIGGFLCLLLVIALAVARPRHWLTAAVCAFLAASPDLFWIPRWMHVRRTGHDVKKLNWFLRFHRGIQWMTGPKLIWVEIVWFVVFTWLVVVRL